MSQQNTTVSVGQSSVVAMVLSMPQEGLKKGLWTSIEDKILIDYVRNHGEGRWNTVQKNSGLMRCPKSCRLRWVNHLRPNPKKGKFSQEEEEIVLMLHAKLGNRWATIAAELPGRSDNEIKNYWNLRFKKIMRLGLPIYPPEAEKHFDPFHHRHNRRLNHYRSQQQNKNNKQPHEKHRPVGQTIVYHSPPHFESLQSPPPLLPQQPTHFGQNYSFFVSANTSFDILSIPQPTQNSNPSYLTNSIPSQDFRVMKNKYGGIGLNLCTKQPSLDHQGLVTPNFPPDQFGSLNLTSSPDLSDFKTFENSIMGVGDLSELYPVQSLYRLHNDVGVEFMAGPLGVTNNNNEMGPELVFEDNNTLSDLLVDGVTGAVNGVTGAGDLFVSGVTRAENFFVDGVSGVGDLGFEVQSMDTTNSLDVDTYGTEAINTDEDIMNLLDFQNDQHVDNYYDNNNSYQTE